MRNDLVNGIKIEIRIDISHEKAIPYPRGQSREGTQLESVYAKLRYSRLKETDTKEYLIFQPRRPATAAESVSFVFGYRLAPRVRPRGCKLNQCE
ncbi:hypothetical protein EVAR_78587_1 [Eumeta japonica]|uniref:Uncharacterized protein n=1 Tax=Eumeta variegata TaxID=151549 RepID=A0A4C1U7U6_EUMVA|nr:hypothetical protein EVAR_78587_1 [Eumeta japonica]